MSKGSRKKKVHPLVAGPLRPYPPPPSEIFHTPITLLVYRGVGGVEENHIKYRVFSANCKLRALKVLLEVNYRGSLPSTCSSEAI